VRSGVLHGSRAQPEGREVGCHSGRQGWEWLDGCVA